MNKLLSILMAVLFSVFSGLEVVAPKEDEFLLNTEEYHSYWSPGSATTISDADLYRQQFKASDNRVPCDVTNIIPTRANPSGDPSGWSFASPHYPIADEEGNWVGSSTTDNFAGWSSPNELPAWVKATEYDKNYWTWVCPEGYSGEVFIVAPVTGNILSSHFACDYGKSMDFEFPLTLEGDTQPTMFKMSIRNAKCWWCCRDKDEPEDGYYTAATIDSLKGREMPAGALLCIGRAGTKVSIQRA